MAANLVSQSYDWPGHFQSGGPQFVGSTINTGGGNVNFAADDFRGTTAPSVHARFKVSDYEGQKNSNPDRVQGTCQWFLQNERYQMWRDSEIDNVLWVSADPGCGKSVLAKSLIDHELRCTESLSSCYFFFKDGEEQGNLLSALCSLLHQLFIHKPVLLRHALLETEKSGGRLQREVLLLWRLLIAAATDPAAENVICILDALDECKEQDRCTLITFLKDFYDQSCRAPRTSWTLKFLITSRPYYDIEIRFQELVHKVPEIRLAGEGESKAIGEEIKLVTSSRVRQIAIDRSLTRRAQEAIEAKLLGIPNRTYLWLHLILDEIRETFDCTERQLSKLIDELPESMHEAYERILARSKSKVEARRILQIVIAATRPLTLREMDVVLAIRDNTRVYNDLDLEGEIHIKRRIRNTCGLFLTVSDAKIYLIHQTAKEFLAAKTFENLRVDQGMILNEWRNSFILQDCDYIMAQACVRYLSFTNFESASFVNYVLDRYRRTRDQNLIYSLTARYHFLEYCATQWGAHVRRLQLRDEDEVVLLSLSLCDAQSQRCELWSTIYYGHEKLRFGSMTNYTSLHIACLIGIERVVSLLLDRATDIDTKSNDIENALQVASAAGHETTVQLLLDRGADINANGRKHGGALQLASEYGHEKIVQLLLEHGANVNAQYGKRGGALIVASERGHEGTVRLLLENGAKINMRGGKYDNALHAASEGGHETTVRLLLEKGRGLKAQAGRSLRAASYQGHEKIVQLLLSKGVDINTKGGEYNDALQAASRQGHEKIVELLLSNGTDIKAQGGYYGNALQAASTGHKTIVELLLSKGAEVNSQGGKYGTALQAASATGQDKIVELLLNKGADVNAQGGQYDNALQAASTGNEKIVELLLSKGAADVNSQGGLYGNALKAASVAGHEKIVELLLNKGADANAQGGLYGNALYEASSRGQEKIVELLLNKGADVNAQGGLYGNALEAASAAGHEKIVELLHNKGAL
jgi:ankyrin repeat domain-containing protein 50